MTPLKAKPYDPVGPVYDPFLQWWKLKQLPGKPPTQKQLTRWYDFVDTLQAYAKVGRKQGAASE